MQIGERADGFLLEQKQRETGKKGGKKKNGRAGLDGRKRDRQADNQAHINADLIFRFLLNRAKGEGESGNITESIHSSMPMD